MSSNTQLVMNTAHALLLLLRSRVKANHRTHLQSFKANLPFVVDIYLGNTKTQQVRQFKREQNRKLGTQLSHRHLVLSFLVAKEKGKRDGFILAIQRKCMNSTEKETFPGTTFQKEFQEGYKMTL